MKEKNEGTGALLRKRLIFYGTVQGVGFRYRARHAAAAVGATGFARNACDGSVEMEIQGTAPQIDQVIGLIERGAFIRVERVDARAIPLVQGEQGFRTD